MVKDHFWKNGFLTRFLTHFWSQNVPFSRHYGIFHWPKHVTTGSKRAKNTCLSILGGLGTTLEKMITPFQRFGLYSTLAILEPGWWPCQIQVLSQKLNGGAPGRGPHEAVATFHVRHDCPVTKSPFLPSYSEISPRNGPTTATNGPHPV